MFGLRSRHRPLGRKSSFRGLVFFRGLCAVEATPTERDHHYQTHFSMKSSTFLFVKSSSYPLSYDQILSHSILFVNLIVLEINCHKSFDVTDLIVTNRTYVPSFFYKTIVHNSLLCLIHQAFTEHLSCARFMRNTNMRKV